MELKDEFDKSINYLYSLYKLVNDGFDDALVEEEDDLSKFMTQEGEKAFYKLLNDEISINDILVQNGVLNMRGADSSYHSTQDYAIDIMLKNNSGYFIKTEFNIIAESYFIGGVEKASREYSKLNNVLHNNIDQ
jgi:hypothetical protein